MKKKTKKKIRITGVLFVLLIIYLICMAIYLLVSSPCKNLIINGLDILSEKDIMTSAKINSKTSITKMFTTNICKKIKKNDYVYDCKLSYSFPSKVIINITENKILFYDFLNKNYVLSNGKTITNDSFIGYPTLINYTPSDILEDLIKGFNKVDQDVIKMISEIEYNPDRYNETIIDEDRFLLRMNDGNSVYINTINIKKLNNYQSIYATIEDKGILYLDSSSKTFIFKKYGDVNESEL